MKRTRCLVYVGLFILTACASTGESTVTSSPPTAFSQPTATETRALPTPSSPGDSVTWRDLQVIMDEAEITESFITEFGSQREPSEGQKFLWVRVTLKNVGNEEVTIPAAESFSVLYAESEFKPIYGHRQGYADYTELGTTLFPEQEVEAWLRFDIPLAADLKDSWFVFLPTSAQVGVLPSSPNYPYAVNKPTYVWKCE